MEMWIYFYDVLNTGSGVLYGIMVPQRVTTRQHAQALPERYGRYSLVHIKYHNNSRLYEPVRNNSALSTLLVTFSAERQSKREADKQPERPKLRPNDVVARSSSTKFFVENTNATIDQFCLRKLSLLVPENKILE
jgi:hypothetical protein